MGIYSYKTDCNRAIIIVKTSTPEHTEPNRTRKFDDTSPNQISQHFSRIAEYWGNKCCRYEYLTKKTM